MRIERQHSLTLEQIHAISERMAKQLEAEYGLSWWWQDQQLKLKHDSLTGVLITSERHLTIELKLGLMARLFAGTLERTIHNHLDELLDE
jgi:putative polyhydroxyalkanoate system protein